jgi:hypothetical protein
MRRIGSSWSLQAAAILLVAAAGCGSDGGKSARPKEPDPAKVIGKLTESAALSSMRRYVRDKTVAAETTYGKECGPLDDAKSQIENIKKAMAAGGDPLLARDLETAKKRLAAVTRRLGKRPEELSQQWGRWRMLNERMKGADAKFIYKVVEHTVDPANEKVPDQRTSTLLVKPQMFTETLGKDDLKFTLTWKKVVRTITGIGSRREYKINWELRHAKLAKAATEKSP